MNLIIGRMHLRSKGDQVRRTENGLAIRIIQLSVSTAVETGSSTNMVLLNGYSVWTTRARRKGKPAYPYTVGLIILRRLI